MKKIIVVIALAIFLMTISVSASELEIYPETIEIDLVGGNSVQVNITINWSGSYSASCELTTYIEPDGEGINVAYSKNNFTMVSNSENRIIMYISTSIALIPETYIITTIVDVKMEKPSEKKEDGESHWYPDDYLPDYNPPELPDDEELDDKEEFNDTIYYKADVKVIPFPFWILGIILFVIMLLYITNKRRKKG